MIVTDVMTEIDVIDLQLLEAQEIRRIKCGSGVVALVPF